MNTTLRDAFYDAGFPEPRSSRKPTNAFEPNQDHENALRLRDEDPAAFARLSPSTRTAVGFYLEARAAAGYTPDQDGER